MAYTGNIPAEQYISTVKDTFNGDNSTTDFTLSRPSLANNLEVFVENVQQEPTTAYTVSGTTLSFTSAPVSGTGNIYVIHRGQAVQTIVPPAGISLNATDASITNGLTVDKNGATVATFDRATSDGDIIDLQKDGSSVGSIRSDSTGRIVYNSANNAGYLGVNDTRRYYWTGTDLSPMTDGGPDLGASSFRFKDLYLSGGVYLGGTGSDNYLQDYEIGEHLATLGFDGGGSSTLYSSENSLSYVKIGHMVHVNGRIRVETLSSPSGNAYITLPFTVGTLAAHGDAYGAVATYQISVPSAYTACLEAQNNTNKVYVLFSRDYNTWTRLTSGGISTSNYIGITLTYYTDA